jgi:hypothetical protein
MENITEIPSFDEKVAEYFFNENDWEPESVKTII